MRAMIPMGWRLWFWWVLACTLGWAVAETAGPSGNIILGGYVRLAMGGIVAGVFQWLVLRRHIAQAGWWVLSSIVAVGVVGTVIFGVGVFNTDVGWIAGTGAYGTVLGVPQWLTLRRQIPRAGWWVLASTVGWVVGGPFGGIGGWAALGAVYGTITGALLVRLLHQRHEGVNPHA